MMCHLNRDLAWGRPIQTASSAKRYMQTYFLHFLRLLNLNATVLMPISLRFLIYTHAISPLLQLSIFLNIDVGFILSDNSSIKV